MRIFSLVAAIVVYLNLYAAGLDVLQDLFDPVSVDHAQTFLADPEFYPAAFTLHPEAAAVQIGQETPLGLVMRMGYVIPDQGSFTGDLTDL